MHHAAQPADSGFDSSAPAASAADARAVASNAEVGRALLNEGTATPAPHALLGGAPKKVGKVEDGFPKRGSTFDQFSSKQLRDLADATQERMNLRTSPYKSKDDGRKLSNAEVFDKLCGYRDALPHTRELSPSGASGAAAGAQCDSTLDVPSHSGSTFASPTVPLLAPAPARRELRVQPSHEDAPLKKGARVGVASV